ncbi:MAG: CocE/NonD family hydrolase [Gammaproteobacteria bacterium]|nr:CocE/NonD family hydrolase [Gammaproteobacteria bacterium]
MLGRCLLVSIICLFYTGYANCADSILWKEIQIPMTEADTKGLEAILVWPNTPGKHPLALISHGSPRAAKDRPGMTAISYLPIAMEFARRGFTAAVVLRRGYGQSGGIWNDTYGSCDSPKYLAAGLSSSRDLHATIDYLGTLAQVDTSRMIAVGVSAGGFATVALTADSPPPGLVLAISFAGGRGSTADNTVCDEDALISAFGELGKTSKVPMLWVYAKNDHFFNPELAQKLLEAFNKNGGKATMIQPGPYQKEGHFLFSTTGIPIWTPLVDTFLANHGIALTKTLLPLPQPKNLPAPPNLSSHGKSDFAAYLRSPPHKAFATAVDGSYGWRSGRRSADNAKVEAVDTCESQGTKDCTLYAVDEALVKKPDPDAL